MNLLRRLAALPGVRVVLLNPAVRRRVAAVLALRFLLVARRTDAPVRLVLNEFRRPSVATYVIRSTGVPVTMLHGRDVEALFELFERGEYEPPPPLVERMAPNRVTQILDIGANVGMFSAWAVGRWPAAHVTAFEPSPESTGIFRDWQRTSGADVELIEACAMPVDGPVGFVEGRGGGSHIDSTGHPTAVLPGVDVFEHLARADFVKLDIEGGEWSLLADPRLGDLHDLTLVMEYHRHLAPYLPADRAARDLLERAGFTVRLQSHNFWGHGTLWAWKD